MHGAFRKYIARRLAAIRNFSSVLSAFCLLAGLALSTAAGPALATAVSEDSRSYYEKAVELTTKGDVRAAIIELKNALQVDPENADARLLLGNIFLALGDGVAAEKQLRDAEKYGIDPSRLVVNLGRALLLQDRFTDLLNSLDPQKYPPDIALEVGLLRADALAGLGQLSEARAAYEAARTDSPGNPDIPLGLARLDFLEGKFDAVESHAAEALALAPDLAEATLLRAEARRQKGDAESAVSLYRSILDGRPIRYQIRARAHLGLAAALMGLNRDQEADKEIVAFRATLPSSPLGPYLAALIRLRAQDIRGAQQTLEGSSRILETFTPASYLFGIVYFAGGDFERARAWLNRHLHDHPENLAARKLLGATLLRLNAIPDAIAVLEEGQRQAPVDAQILLQLGDAYMRAGRTSESSDLFKRAAELAPRDPRALRQLAISYVATGQKDEALTVLNTSLDLGAEASVVGYAIAFAHLRSGDYQAALQVAQDLRKRFPTDAIAANLEGAALAALGKIDDARKSFEAALKAEPGFIDAHANLAALKLKVGDLAGAERDYSDVLQSDAKNVAALLGLAGVAQRRGDQAAARTWLSRAVEAQPDAINPTMALAENYAAAGDILTAIDLLNLFVLKHAADARALFALARFQSLAGRYSDALETHKRLVEITHGAVDARTLLAQAYLAAGDPEGARGVLEGLLADNPDHRPTVEALISLISKHDGPQAAFAYAEGLVKSYPDAAWNGQLIGDLNWRIGRLEDAIASYQAGWAKKPTASLAMALSRAETQRAIQQHHSDQGALVPLEQWLQNYPADDTVRLALAETQLNLGNSAAAIEEYEALKKTQADNPTVWNNLAWLYQQAGDERAIAHGERALELAPGQPEVMDTLGWIYLMRGQIDQATDLLGRARQSAPDSAVIAFHYALALHKKEDDRAARGVLELLLQSGKPFAEQEDAQALLRTLTP